VRQRAHDRTASAVGSQVCKPPSACRRGISRGLVRSCRDADVGYLVGMTIHGRGPGTALEGQVQPFTARTARGREGPKKEIRTERYPSCRWRQARRGLSFLACSGSPSSSYLLS
jgi:hypothetical protein